MQGVSDRIAEEPSLQNNSRRKLRPDQRQLAAEVAVVQVEERVDKRRASAIRNVEGLTHGRSASKSRQACD